MRCARHERKKLTVRCSLVSWFVSRRSKSVRQESNQEQRSGILVVRRLRATRTNRKTVFLKNTKARKRVTRACWHIQKSRVSNAYNGAEELATRSNKSGGEKQKRKKNNNRKTSPQEQLECQTRLFCVTPHCCVNWSPTAQIHKLHAIFKLLSKRQNATFVRQRPVAVRKRHVRLPQRSENVEPQKERTNEVKKQKKKKRLKVVVVRCPSITPMGNDQAEQTPPTESERKHFYFLKQKAKNHVGLTT